MNVCCISCDLSDVTSLYADQNILRLDVGVDYLALRVEVLQALQNLSKQNFNSRYILTFIDRVRLKTSIQNFR